MRKVRELRAARRESIDWIEMKSGKKYSYNVSHTAQFIKSTGNKSQYPETHLPGIAFAGRSNVGKSSLINCLIGQGKPARISSTPGRTQHINFFLVDDSWMFIDLPGYGYARVSKKVRDSWGPMIEELLTECSFLEMTIVLVDSRHDATTLDKLMVDWLSQYGIEFIVVATKIDKVPRSKRTKQIKQLQSELHSSRVIPFSSTTGEGRDELWAEIEKYQ